MNREDTIYKLKQLISDYQEEQQTLSEMIDAWNDFDDPGSDPGLQFEQEMVVKSAYNKIVEFAKQM